MGFIAEGGNGSILYKCCRTRINIGFNLFKYIYNLLIASYPAHPIAGHGAPLGERIKDNNPFFCNLQDAVRRFIKINFTICLVRSDDDIILMNRLTASWRLQKKGLLS